MGDFHISIKAVGGHGCQREIKDGGIVGDCGWKHCPDCIVRRCVAELKASGNASISEATIQHWPNQTPDPGPREDLLTGVRKGSF